MSNLQRKAREVVKKSFVVRHAAGRLGRQVPLVSTALASLPLRSVPYYKHISAFFHSFRGFPHSNAAEPREEMLSDADELDDPPRRRLLAGALVPT